MDNVPNQNGTVLDETPSGSNSDAIKKVSMLFQNYPSPFANS